MSARKRCTNRCSIWLCLLVVTIGVGLASRASAQTLTNVDVVKMVQAKLSDSLIISEIKHSTCNFDTSPTALIKLKQAGVSDAVLQAMTEARHTASPAAAASSPSNPNASLPAPVITAENAASLRPEVLARVGGNAYDVNSAADGRIVSILSIGKDLGVILFDAETGAEVGRCPANFGTYGISGSGRLVAQLVGNAVVLCDPKSLSPSLGSLQAGTVGFTSVALSPDGRLLATGRADGAVQLWYVATRRLLWSSSPPRSSTGVMKVTVTDDRQVAALYLNPNTLRYWNAVTGVSREFNLSATQERIGDTGILSFVTAGKVLVSLTSTTWLLDVNDEEGRARSFPRRSNALAPDGRTVVSLGQYVGAGRSGYTPLTIWDLDTGTNIATLRSPMGMLLVDATFTSTGKVLLTGSLEGVILKWPLQPQPPQSPPGEPSTPTQTTAPVLTAGCANFVACMRAGISAFQDSNLSAAIPNFQGAARLGPAYSEPWEWLGRSYLREGQTEQFTEAWDKAISLGGGILIGACREVAFRPCERGHLDMTTNSVYFRTGRGQLVFNAPPSDVSAKGIFNSSTVAHVSFGLRVQSKNYNFDFFPFGVNCNVGLLVQCPAQAMAQQLAVANYVEQTIPKLASGALAVAPPPTPPSPPPATTPTASGAASTAGNEPATDLNFERFYNVLRATVDRRDSTGLRNLMAEKFQWAMDGYVSREKAFKNIGEIIGWEKFWQAAQTAMAQNPSKCRPPYCERRPGYHTWAKSPFPLEMMFEQLPRGEWRWTAVLGD